MPFLCGIDHYTQQSYEHRKPWVLDKIKQLASIFTIDICAYAIMSNHYHLILHINLLENRNLSDSEVAARWQQRITGPDNGTATTFCECLKVENNSRSL
ncbi:hypothetical protein [Motilimonas sp. E26]|uniref:hypothetical protein n=1 Tax=Motilimonas sp. E26 TaxID=2865674 RepID=UPI001E338C42|nr:hypothetical protein [Motilimonas sp. E26]MCE0555526.1 hypothetical protein [Motilimonas sp. E26]